MDNTSACLGFSRKDPIPESTEAVVTMSLSGYGSYNFRFFNLWLSLGVWALRCASVNSLDSGHTSSYFISANTVIDNDN